MDYATFWIWRWVLAAVMLVLAAITIFFFAKAPRKISTCTAFLTVFWALGPPIWFFVEYYAVDHDWIVNLPGTKDALLHSVTTYADYASKIWAAVVATILFLVKKD